jgi:hypothetical protein
LADGHLAYIQRNDVDALCAGLKTLLSNHGQTVLIAQLQGSAERVFKSGDAVMVQYGSTVNRILSADSLPEKVAKPRGVVVAGATGEKIDVKVCDKATTGRAQREACTQH